MTGLERPDRVDTRLVPVAAAAWAGAWAGTAGTLGPVAAAFGGAAGLGLAAGLRRSPRAAAVAVVLLVCALVGMLHAYRVTSGPTTALARERAVVVVEAVLTADPRTSEVGPRNSYLTARVRSVELAGRGSTWAVGAPLLVVATGSAAMEPWRGLPVGSRVRFTARLQAPDPGSEVSAVARVRDRAVVVAPPGPTLRAVETVRAGLRDAVRTRPPEPRALVPALVLGDTSAMSPALEADFRTTGLTHLTAVSGANLTLLLAFLLLAARWLGVRGWWLRAVGLAGVAVFVALCRTEPSVLRAAAMGLVALAALGTGSRRRGLRHLGVAVLVLVLVDPFLGRSLGFTLSVLASAGIVWWAGRWADLLAGWLPRPVAESVAVPLAAHLATLPVVAAVSGQVSVVGVVTNALAGPLVGPATVLGFAAAGASVIAPPLAELLGWAASWCAQGILWVAHAGAVLPGSAWRWPAEPRALVLLGAVVLLGAAVLPVVLARWWAGVLLSVVMVTGLLAGPVQPGWPPRDWILVACDVGQGDGLVVSAGAGAAVVVDVGPDPEAMNRCLGQLHVRTIPVLVLTHFHADHVGGLAGALDGRAVDQIWVSPLGSPPTEAAAVHRVGVAAGAEVLSPAVGERGGLPGVGWEVLGPVGADVPAGDGTDPESAAENDASLVLRLSARGVRILLTGDVEPEGQARILAAGGDLRADVLKVPHHGSARQDPAFLAATGARVAVASAGQRNDYGHPAPRTVQLLTGLGMSLLRTDEQGSVALTLHGGRLAAVTQRR